MLGVAVVLPLCCRCVAVVSLQAALKDVKQKETSKRVRAIRNRVSELMSARNMNERDAKSMAEAEVPESSTESDRLEKSLADIVVEMEQLRKDKVRCCLWFLVAALLLSLHAARCCCAGRSVDDGVFQLDQTRPPRVCVRVRAPRPQQQGGCVCGSC